MLFGFEEVSHDSVGCVDKFRRRSSQELGHCSYVVCDVRSSAGSCVYQDAYAALVVLGSLGIFFDFILVIPVCCLDGEFAREGSGGVLWDGMLVEFFGRFGYVGRTVV